MELRRTLEDGYGKPVAYHATSMGSTSTLDWKGVKGWKPYVFRRKGGCHYVTAFFAQQAAEKALKGFLYSKGFRALITHSVTELLEESSKHEKIFERHLDQGKELDRHYIGSRYPNFYPRGPAYKYYTQEMATKCLGYAESILKEVKKFLER